MTNHVVAGLLDRRDQLVAEVRRTEAILRRLIDDIATLDGAIQQFDPSLKPVRTEAVYAGSAHVTRMLLTILRKSPEPMTLRALALRVLQASGLDPKDRKRVTRMREQCRTALARQRENGTVVKEPGPGLALVWKIAK